jgi:hypothetical protein
MFVDFAGQTIPVLEPATGEVRAAHLFIAVLGASNFTYAEATWGEDLASWIGAHVHALEFFQGVPELVAFESQTEITWHWDGKVDLEPLVGDNHALDEEAEDGLLGVEIRLKEVRSELLDEGTCIIGAGACHLCFQARCL